MKSPPLRPGWMQIFPPLTWLAAYESSWLRHDAIAGVTLAAYAIPVSLAYAGLAGLPPQVGIYGYLLGGLGYALLGSSRQLAVGPTSAISLMMAGAVGALAGGDPMRYAQIASLAAFAVATLCLIAWLFKLSILVRLISDSILVGFKAGAGLTIIMSHLPSLFGVTGRHCIHLAAASPSVAPEHCVPRTAARDRPLFRQRQARRCGAAGRRHRVPARSLAALYQCRDDS